MNRWLVSGLAIVFILALAACNKQGVIDEADLGSPAPSGGMVPATPVGDDGGMAGMDMGAVSIPPDADKVTVAASEFAFAPADLSVPAEKPVVVTLVNEGQVEHDWVVFDATGQEIDGAHAHAAAGLEGVAVFELKPGTYEVHCTIPGHQQAGMTGSVTAG